MKLSVVTARDERTILHVFKEGHIEESLRYGELSRDRYFLLCDKEGNQIEASDELAEVLSRAKTLGWTELQLPKVKFLFFTECGHQIWFETEKELYLWAAHTGKKGRIEKHIQ